MRPRRGLRWMGQAGALLGVAGLRLSAAVVSQCEVMDGGVVTDTEGRVLAWDTFRGGAAWLPAVTGSPAWGFPALEPGGIAFDAPGDTATPLASAAPSVATLFLVVSPSLPAEGFATLVEVPGASVTAAARADPPVYDPEDAAGLSVRVNGLPAPGIPDAPHIVEVDFAQTVLGCDLRIGGASACAVWRQPWRGRVVAAIAFDNPPDEPVRRKVRSYLARRHGVAGDFTPAGREAVIQAIALGIHTHGLFSTRFFLK